MNIEKDVVITENTPRPFLEIPKLWLQLNKMSEDFFRQEIVHTSAKNTLLGVLIDTGVATAISVLFSILSVAFSYSTQPSSLINNILVISILFSCGQIFLVPVGFYFNVAITFISALIFGGKGTFNSQAYLESLFTVPLGLISSVFIFAWLIPSIGNYVVYIWLFGIMIIRLIFMIRIFKVVHNFTTIRAIVAVLAPVLLLLIPICMVGTLALMGPAIGNVFSTMNTNLSTPIP